MYTDFDQMPLRSRVWIYQADRVLTDDEEKTVKAYLRDAVESWAAHGVPLLGSFSTAVSRFVVLAVNEDHHQPSGCSIDTSSRWFKELGDKLGIDFFDRSQGYFEGEDLKFFPVLQGKKYVESGVIGPETLLINNMVPDLEAYRSRRFIKASESHLKRFFQQQAV